MKISKVYYEELRSVCINGNWTSKKIGAEVELEEDGLPTECLRCAKEFVRATLNLEIPIEDNKKYKKAFEKVRKSLEYEVDKIEEEEMPF